MINHLRDSQYWLDRLDQADGEFASIMRCKGKRMSRRMKDARHLGKVALREVRRLAKP